MNLIGKISSNLGLVSTKLQEYEEILVQSEKVFDMDNRKLEELCKSHPYNYAYYKKKLYEVKCIEDLVEIKLDAVQSGIYKKLNEHHSRALSSKDIQVYINGDTDFIAMKEVLLEVVFVKKQFEAVVDALISMGYSLNNITKIRVADLEETVI